VPGDVSDTPLWRHIVVERKTISIMKACELVGVSRRTIYNWLSSGKIEYVRTAGGSVRIFVDTLWRDPNRGERTASPTTWQPQEEHTQA
jgi:excisionase family DNA binding protein